MTDYVFVESVEGTYIKALYDDWINGGRLDLILDAVAADTTYIADGSLPASPAANSLARFIASGGTALGSPLPASKSLYNILGTGYIHDNNDFSHSIRRHLRRGLAGANATDVLTETDSLYGGLVGNINAVNRVAGKLQIATTTIDLHQAAGTYDLFIGTTQDVLLEMLVIRLPNVDVSDDTSITAISIQTDDVTARTIIASDAGAKANLTAEAQVAYPAFCGDIMIKAGTKIRLTIVGGTADAETICDVTAKYRAITSGGYLA